MQFIPAELIKKKRDGGEHTQSEISFLIEQYSQNQLPDYQMSAWLMAALLKGLTPEETYFLTEAMLNSGEQMDLSHIPKPKVDKHSTGGVGDKTTMILAPLVAAADIVVPTIAGRGLGHTGGTLDKLESIPTTRTRIEEKEALQILEKIRTLFYGTDRKNLSCR